MFIILLKEVYFQLFYTLYFLYETNGIFYSSVHRSVTLQEVYAIVGRRIRELRKRLKLTQEGLAEECGLDFRSVGAVERGERNLSLKSLSAIAKALKIKPEILIQEEETPPQEEKKALLHELVYTLENEDVERIRFVLQDAKNFLHYEKQKKKKRRKNG